MKDWLNRPPSKEAAKELLNMSLEDKVYQTCVNINDWDIFTDGKWYISFSGGKDSTVLAYIAAKLLNGSPIPRTLHLLFYDTGLEYPEIRKFVDWYAEWLQKQFPRVTIDLQRRRPKQYFVDVIRDHGYPLISKVVAHNIWQARNSKSDTTRYLRLMCIKSDGTLASLDNAIPLVHQSLLKAPFQVNSYCCDATKKQPAHQYVKETGRLPMIAVMADESRARMKKWKKIGCNAFEGKEPQSNPMSFWKNQDILRYIRDEGVPICSVYGEILCFDGEDYYQESFEECSLRCTGCQRTGCVFCGFGITRDLPVGEKNRFQMLKETHPKHWDYAINGGEWDPVDGMWKPSKTPGHIGLGMGRVLDYIGVPYE